MSLSQAIAASTAGLRITQAALALTAANVANAETPGYVRKTLVQATTAAGGNNVSVRIAAVNRELDQYLQRQLRTETSGGSYADLRSQFYSRLQQIYGTPGSATTLESTFNNLTTAVQALSTSPESASARSAVLTAAQVLTQQLNSMTQEIQGLRTDAELGLSDAANRANNAMAQIAAINRQLATSSASDATAATLLDQRDALIDQLSQLMDIRVVETDHNQVNIFTNSGIQLVGTQAAQFAFDAHGTITATAQWSADPAQRTVGTLQLVLPSGGSYDLIANGGIRSGEIAALVEMRDRILPEAQAQLDGFAEAMARALSEKTVNGSTAVSGAQTGFDIDTSGLLAGNTINLTYTDTATGKVHRISIVRVNDPSALPLSNDATIDPNDEVIGVDFSGGLGAVANALNARFNGKIQFADAGGGVLRILDDGLLNNSDINAVTATVTQTAFGGGSAELPFFTDAGNPYTGAFTSLGSQRVGFAGRITVNPALLADPSKLVLYDTATASGDSTRPDFIYDRLANAALAFAPQTGIGTTGTPFTGTLSSFIRQVTSMQGEAAANAANLAAGQSVVVNALKSRVAEGAAVNIDTEMANLLTLQTAYAANARILSVVKEMMDTLMKL
jgi:flagellar hook-associated protein 1 FlgK